MGRQLSATQTIDACAAWPCEADFILSTLDTASSPEIDPRMRGRGQFRIAAQLQFLRDEKLTDALTVYTRDVSTDGLGFIAREMLEIGQKAVLHVCGTGNSVSHLECTIYRCRAVASGWFEGAVTFTKPQDELLPPACIRAIDDSE